MVTISSEKTEKATPKRRRDERKKGHVFKGHDIVIAVNLLVMFYTLKIIGEYIYQLLQQSMVAFISSSNNVKYINKSVVSDIVSSVFLRVMVCVLPLLLISAITSFLATGVQTRFIFSPKSVSFKLSRLNPINGIKQKFSARAIVNLTKSLLMFIVLVIIVYNSVAEFTHTLGAFYLMDVKQAIFYLSDNVFDIFIKVCFVVFVFGVLDFFFQWWQYERDIRMSKQEIKEEFKMTEGDPQIKSAIKSRQQKIAQRRMMKKVPEADVVIVNPDHFAVALKYDEKKGNAPVVIAKGAGYIALKIKEIAAQHNIRIEENPPLARALYKAVEIDQEIPPEFYHAVAEILAYVYSLRRRRV